MKDSMNESFDTYEICLKYGLSAELARIVLPVATYTEWYWQIDMHNFLHFLNLRLDSHAQYEVRVYAEAMLKLVEDKYPTIIKSWKNLHQEKCI